MDQEISPMGGTETHAMSQDCRPGTNGLLIPWARPLLGLALSVPLILAGCARSVNDHLIDAKSNSPEAIKDAVVAIGELLDQKESGGYPFDEADLEAILYVKEVAAGNPVPINRAAAIAALGKLHKAGAAEVFMAALKDPFWPCRLEACRAMGIQPEDRFADPLRQLLGAESRVEVRLEAIKSLGKVRGPVALKALLEVFLRRGEGAKDPQILAYFSICDMTGLKYGFEDVRKWGDFYRDRYGKDNEVPPPGAPGKPEGPMPVPGKESLSPGGDSKPVTPVDGNPKP